MKDVLTAVIPVLVQALAPTLLAALTWLIVRGTQWAQAHTKNAYLQGTLGRLGLFVGTTVQQLEQTVVADLKAANGKWTPEVAAKVKADALAQVKQLLGKQGLLEIEKVLGVQGGDVEKFLGDAIESAVHKLPPSVPGNPQ